MNSNGHGYDTVYNKKIEPKLKQKKPNVYSLFGHDRKKNKAPHTKSIYMNKKKNEFQYFEQVPREMNLILMHFLCAT